MKYRKIFSVIFFIFTTNADDSFSSDISKCLGPDHGRYNNSKIDFSFSSWILPPRAGGIKHLFGKCIHTNSKQYFKAAWRPTLLRGTIEFDRPLYSEIPFPTNRSIEINSTINFGIRDIREDELNVKLIVAEDEKIDRPDDGQQNPDGKPDPTRALLRRIALKELEQSQIDDISTLTSRTGFSLSHPNVFRPIYIEFEVSSTLPARDGERLYNSEITISAQIQSPVTDSDLRFALLSNPIRIMPSNPFLIYNLYDRNRYMEFSELINGGRIRLPMSPISLNNFDLAIEEFKLYRNGEVVGSFFASIYTDGGTSFGR